MANYTINNKKRKEIIVTNSLSDMEKEIIAIYISQGYNVYSKDSRNTTINNKRLKEKDIINWFNSTNNSKGLKEYKAKKEEKIIDKQGKQRKAGFLVAQKWFKEKYPDAYNEIKAIKEN